MLNTSSLSNIFWLNKTKNKETIVLSEEKVEYLEIEILKHQLSSFLRISKDNNLSKLTIVSSVFSFLLDRYFDNYQNIIKVYPCDLIQLTNSILLEVPDDKEITFKKQLKNFASDIKEAVSYSNYDASNLDLTGFSNCSIQFNQKLESIQDDTSLFYNESGDKIVLGIYYKDVYKGYVIDSLLNSFIHILSNYDRLLDTGLADYTLVAGQEAFDILINFNTTTDYPSDKTIIDLFESQVKESPDALAVVYGDIALSYADLNRESNRLAYYLKDQYRIHGDDLICIQLPRNEKMIISILGILKSGGAYVPVDVDYPEERIDYILTDTKAKVNIDATFLTGFDVLKNEYPTTNPESLIQPGDLAYVIYTSGTTGNPKGVMIEHRNVFHSTINRITFYNIESMLLIPSFSFDSSVAVIFGTLCSGGRLFIESNIHVKDVEYISSQIIKNKIQGLLCVPNYYSNLLPYVNENTLGSNTLKYVIVAGEELSKNLVLNHQKYSDAILYNEYGPTECAVWSSVSIVNHSDVNIGKPISNTEIYILDEYGHLVPVGVNGELYIAGAGLARGYLNREDLTSEKFVDNPFVEGTKMYRTGDLGRWLPDGSIEYLGRIDDQVKIRGHRIELGEIDSQVLSYGEAIKAVVTEVKEHEGDKRLVVYYVSDSVIDKQELAYYLETKLPQYMLPSYYIALESIPLTSNGKIDRRNLPEVSSEDLIKTEYIAPRTLEEKLLIEVCEQVLKHSTISIRDSYYNLGGDSIKSIQIVSRLRQRGYSLKVEHILQYPVLEELSHYMTTDVVLIDQSTVSGVSLLTPIQRYFFESEEFNNKNHYNQSVILKSNERLSSSVLESSIQSLVHHHDTLRMVYHQQDGIWSQNNAGTEGTHYHFEYFDLKEEGSPEKELIALQKVGQGLQGKIHIESGILFHVGHISMSDGDRLLLIIHHLVVDGVSWRILMEDLGNLYEAGLKGESYDLPSKTNSFQSWGEALESYSNSSALFKERLYWEGVESEVYSGIPTDHPVNRKYTLDKNIGFTLNEESTRLLQTRAGKNYTADINDVLLTGLALSLQDQFGINKTKVLMEGHGREVMGTGLDISRTVGWFTSVYPFSLDISNNSQPALVSIKEGLRNVPNKGIGYGILNYLSDAFSSGNHPSVQFNYLGDFDDRTGSAFHYTSENIGNPVAEENLYTDILLDVSGMTVNGEMNINLRYSGNLFNESTVQKLVDSYQIQLEKMISEGEESEVVLTPSDLTYKRLSFNTIQEINRNHDIEDIYGLSPMQQGLYYHWMVEPKGSAYFMQTSYRIKSKNIDISAVKAAFGILINRYTVLRTSFNNHYGEVPLQIVHKNAHIDFKHLILESEFELDNIKQGDITRGFNLIEPTQMRLMVIELPHGDYEFIWSHHHIIMDGWCLNILINNFSAILSSLEQKSEISLPESKDYSSYIKWLEGVDKEAAAAYWENYLKGVILPTLIPSKKNASEAKSHFIAEILKIENEEFKSIKNFCQSLGITLNTYLQGVWAYLLSSYNASEEVVFGSVVSGRPAELEGIENMVGLFINTIPVRVNLDKSDTPRSLLEKIHQDSIQSTGYHFTGLAEIQSFSSLGKELINNIIIFENYARQDANEDLSIMGLVGQDVDTFEQTSYDFNIVAVPGDHNLLIDFKYNSSVFYPSFVKSLVEHFKSLIGQFATFPDLAINNLSYLSTNEVKELLEDFSGTEVLYSSENTVVNLFEEQVNNCAHSLAIESGLTKLNYADLNIESNRLAHYLRDHHNIRTNDLVCIQLPRDEKMIISILGILKSGGAYVPIDMNYPQERTEYIIKDTKSKLYIDESFWKEFDSLKENYSTENPTTEIHPSDLAYVIYTSGTTGNPKGVCISHSNLMNYVSWSNGYYFNNEDRGNWGLFTSISFDLSVTAVFCSLTRGSSLWLGENEEDILAVLIKAFENKDIDILKLTPSHISLLKNIEIHNTGIRKIILGGEKLYNEHIQIIHAINKDIEVYDEYGPTEATVGCIARKVDLSVNTIGSPISNTQIYILDEYGHLLPAGVHGELYIAGAGLARGYLNREDLTSEKFVANPFVEGTKMYRTGDLGRWLPDGTIEYLGRTDHQVKIRGHRIELREIDSQVLSYNSGIQSVVTEVKEHEGDKSLVVYFVSDSVINKQELAYYLEGKLPQYMLPSFYVELDRIPLTSNGKIDRKNLPKVSSSDLIKTEYVAPGTAEEKALVEVCEQVLKYSPVSIRDNYYNLGGDSIKSIQIVSRLRQRGYSLKVEHILQYPVLEELAHYMTTDVAVIDQSVVTGDSILTPIQRYFFESEELVDKNHYNQAVILKSSERLSDSVLESSICTLVNHHDALRMEYREENGVWSQYNLGTEGNHYHFEYFDIREDSSTEDELASLQKIGDHLQSTINIESGILFHVGHVSMSDGDRIILVIHHLVVDGISWRILLEDLGNLYESGIKGGSYDLPSKTDSFQSWGEALENYSKSSVLSKERLYWEGVESEVYPAIPTDHASKGRHILDNTVSFSLSEASTKLLQTQAGKKYSAEINDVLLTGLALSLQDQFGINKTKVLMEGHGREVMGTGLDISRTVGWFTSVYPFSLDISNKNQPALVSVKEDLRGIPHKGIGYGVLNYLGNSFSPVNNPSVQFNYLGDFDDTVGLAFYYSSEAIGNPVSEENLGTDILLDVSGITMSGAMTITIRYSGDLFNEVTVQKLIDSYQSHLEKMIDGEKETEVILTPSDLTYKGLSFSTIQEINKNQDIEDIYELSPMQQGLYYHWMAAPKGSAYFMQTSYRAKSEGFDLSLVERAFEILVNRYTVLRTSFDNRFGEVPLQIVHQHARVDFKHLILESELELDNIKQGDIARGFNLIEPTQMRLLVVELPNGYYEFIWSYHHIIMDGWCLSILVNDFTAILDSLQQGVTILLPDTEKYASYIKWLESVDKEEALAYWENYLQGIDSPTLIPFVRTEKEEASHYLTETLIVRDHDLERTEKFCQNLGITLNTYVQGVWSYLLSSYNASEEVVFGSVVSGRPAEV
ncbi:non-ribosomal peptide synthetase, partial [Chryseobacterium gregarium]|uniref:non-ribosomal peptide synthetase n=1 Tax=Chryseobacterium gregarium TaxID=456299 RepID=UPI00048920A6